MKKLSLMAILALCIMSCTKVMEHPKAPTSNTVTVAPPEMEADGKDEPGPTKFKKAPNY